MVMLPQAERDKVPEGGQRENNHDVCGRELAPGEPFVVAQPLIEHRQGVLEAIYGHGCKQPAPARSGIHGAGNGAKKGAINPVPPKEKVGVVRVWPLEEEPAVCVSVGDIFHDGAAFRKGHMAVLDHRRGTHRVKLFVFRWGQQRRPVVRPELVVDTEFLAEPWDTL